MSETSALIKIPENTSFLQPNKFSFEIPSLPFLRYFGQDVTLPSVSTNAVDQPSPFAMMKRHGDRLNFDQLTCTILLDEDMRSWEETYNWLRSLTKPDNYGEYVRFLNPTKSPYHDAILTINTNSHNPNLRFKFTNVHPVSLGAVHFSHRQTADEVLVADIVFSYDQYYMQRLTTA
jgi:hypothetical protein